MYVCVCVYIYVCMCMCIYICMYVYMYIYIYTHTHSGIRLSPKKEQNNAICSNMDGTIDPHTK